MVVMLGPIMHRKSHQGPSNASPPPALRIRLLAINVPEGYHSLWEVSGVTQRDGPWPLSLYSTRRFLYFALAVKPNANEMYM